MAERDLKLRVVFEALDKITAPLKKISSVSGETGKALKATSDRLRDLNKTQKDISRFRELHSGLDATSTKLTAAQQRIAGLAAKMREVDTPTRAMTREFNAAVKAAGALKESTQQQSQQLQIVRDRLSSAGVGMQGLAQHERTLRSEIVSTNKTMTEQQAKLSALAAHEKKIAGAKQHADKLRATAGHVAMAGIGATAGGIAIGAPLLKGVTEAKHYQTESARVTALGLGTRTSADAIKFAREMKTYGTSHTENLELVRDSMSIFGDLHHAEMVAPTLAKMKFGNKAFYGAESGEENERKFMDLLKVIEQRGGTGNSEKFHTQANMVQKVITATGGRVGPTEWLNFLKTGGIAAKIMDDKSFYYQMEPLVQEVGGHRAGTALMSGYSNLYQGRTTKRAVHNLEKLGLISDISKVQHDKAGQISTLGPGALLGSDVFRRSQFEWLETVLLPQLAKKGITDENKIEDTIGGLFSTRTAGGQFLDMYRQRAQIHKNAKLNAGAYDIDQITALAKGQAGGKEMDAESKLADIKLVMGEKILPLYVKGLEMATGALEALTGFMERNPTTAKVMLVGFATLAALLVVIGPLMLAIASMVGPYAMLYVMFAKMGISGGVLTPILRGIGSAFMWVGRAVLWLGRAFLMNPIGLAITAIAVGAYLIYRYWEPIKGFFSQLWENVTGIFHRVVGTLSNVAGGLWADIKTAFAGGILGIGALILNWSPLGLFYQAFAGVMAWFGVELPAKFSEFGSNIIRGLADGIINAAAWVQSAIKGIGDSVIGVFQKKMDMHSPSRVFAELGDYTMQGLVVGLQRSEDGPLSQVAGMAKRLTQIGAGIAIGAAAVPASAFDTRPPITAPGAMVATQPSQNSYEIHIHAAPGMDAQAIARAVSLELDRRDREKSARRRSSLHDQ